MLSRTVFRGGGVSQALEFGAVIIREPGYEIFEGLNRRSLHPIDSISRRLDFICTTATDALQIAAALESDGINDRIAREEYGFSDVFELAEELYRRVPLRPPDYVPVTFEPPVRIILKLTRGLMIAPFLVMVPALASTFGARSVAFGVMVALAATWIWGLLALPRDSDLRAGGRDDEARRNLWTSAGAAVLAAVLVDAALTVITAGRLEWIAAQILLSLLLISGLMLIARAKEGWLWLALAPGGLIAALGLSGGWPVWIVLAGMVATVALTLGGAWLASLEDAYLPVEPDAGSARPDWLAVAAFGALSFGLFALLPGLAWGRGDARAGFSDACALLPLLGAAGVLEWGIGRFRRWAARSLTRAKSPAGFVRRVRWGFLLFLAGLAVVLAGLALVDLRLCAQARNGLQSPRALTLLVADAALGLALASSLMLIGRSRVRELIAPWTVGLGLIVLAVVAGLVGAGLVNAFLGVGTLLMVWTAWLTWRSLGSVAG